MAWCVSPVTPWAAPTGRRSLGVDGWSAVSHSWEPAAVRGPAVRVPLTLPFTLRPPRGLAQPPSYLGSGGRRKLGTGREGCFKGGWAGQPVARRDRWVPRSEAGASTEVDSACGLRALPAGAYQIWGGHRAPRSRRAPHRPDQAPHPPAPLPPNRDPGYGEALSGGRGGGRPIPDGVPGGREGDFGFPDGFPAAGNATRGPPAMHRPSGRKKKIRFRRPLAPRSVVADLTISFCDSYGSGPGPMRGRGPGCAARSRLRAWETRAASCPATCRRARTSAGGRTASSAGGNAWGQSIPRTAAQQARHGQAS